MQHGKFVGAASMETACEAGVHAHIVSFAMQLSFSARRLARHRVGGLASPPPSPCSSCGALRPLRALHGRCP